MKWPGEPRLLDEEITLSQGRIKESKLSSKFGTKSTLKTKTIWWEKVWSIWVNPRELMHISLSRNTVTSSKKLRINHTSEKKALEASYPAHNEYGNSFRLKQIQMSLKWLSSEMQLSKMVRFQIGHLSE